MQQPEAKFKRALIEGYQAVFPQGWYNYNQANRRAGIPDLYFTVRREPSANPHMRSVFALPVWIEAKVDTKVTKLQTEIMRRMAAAGNKTVVVRALGMKQKKPHRHVVVLNTVPDTGLTMFGWADMKTLAFWQRILDA